MSMKKRVTISLLFLMLAMVLAGCGGISKKKEQAARELIDKMITAADGAVVSKSDCTTELRSQLIFGGKEVSYGADYQTHNEYDKESGRVNSIINYTNDGQLGSTKFHMAEELGVFYIYRYQEEIGWIKYDSGFAKEEMSRNFVSDMNLENAEIVEYIENYKKVNEKNVHRLRVKLKDAPIRELVFESGVKELFWGREYNSIDMSDTDIQVDYYVDANTSQVVELEVKLESMNNFMQEFVLCRNVLVDGEFESVKSSKGTLKYENISYDDVKVPMLSVEEKKASFLVHQESATYNLKVMEAEADIVCPKGWMVLEKGTDNLSIASTNDKVEINYYLYFPITIEEFEKEVIPSDIEYYKEVGLYVSDKKESKIGEYETHEVVMTDGVLTYAYTPLKRAILAVVVEDYTGELSSENVEEFLDMVDCKEIDW